MSDERAGNSGEVTCLACGHDDSHDHPITLWTRGYKLSQVFSVCRVCYGERDILCTDEVLDLQKATRDLAAMTAENERLRARYESTRDARRVLRAMRVEEVLWRCSGPMIHLPREDRWCGLDEWEVTKGLPDIDEGEE